MDKQDPGYEEIRLRGIDLAARVGDLLRQPNVRRLMIRDDSDITLLEIPVNASTASGSTPVLSAVGAMGATLPGFRIVIVRTEQARRTATPAASRTGATEDQMNTHQMVAQRIDNHGTRVEDLAGTGEHDAPGG